MKFKYLLFKDAPHLKEKSEPDEMIADVKLLGVDEIVELPYIVATASQLADYQMSISEIMLKWQATQPYLIDGKEHFMIDGELKPRPSLEQDNS